MKFIMLVAALFYVGSAQAERDWERYIPKPVVPSNVDCGSVQARGFGSLRYCLRVNPQSRNLVVHLHGAGQTEESFFRTDRPDPVLSEIKRSGAAMPSIISLSAGRSRWFTIEQGDGASDAMQALIAQVRQRAQVDDVVLYGVSMGGFNGLQVFMQKPQLFQRALFSCPAWTEADPFDDNSWESDPDTAAAKMVSRWAFRKGLTSAFSGSTQWRNNNPMGVLRHRAHRVPAAGVDVMVTTVGNDGFGFVNTPVTGVNLLRSRGYNVTHHKTAGAEHCFPTASAVAQFLIR